MKSNDSTTSLIAQGDLQLLRTVQVQRLLNSTIPARLAFIWTDNTPRVLPTWFHWNGEQVVMVTYAAGTEIGIRHPARRIAALRANPVVAVTIDTEGFPPEVLQIRGSCAVTEVDGVAPEYALAARRYLGEEAGDALITAVDQPGTRQVRIVVQPSWVSLIDFQSRLPSAQGGLAPTPGAE
jgi:hypothetical protein